MKYILTTSGKNRLAKNLTCKICGHQVLKQKAKTLVGLDKNKPNHFVFVCAECYFMNTTEKIQLGEVSYYMKDIERFYYSRSKTQNAIVGLKALGCRIIPREEIDILKKKFPNRFFKLVTVKELDLIRSGM